MRIICEKRHGQWSAWIEGRPETACGGRTHRGALRRLVADIPEVDLSQMRPAHGEMYPGRIVFVCTEPCTDCGGTGKYVGLLKVENCERCRGTGRIDESCMPF